MFTRVQNYLTGRDPLLELAKQYRDRESMRKLERKVREGKFKELNAKNEQGQTPIVFLAHHFVNEAGADAVRALAEAGADVNATTQNGATILQLAARVPSKVGTELAKDMIRNENVFRFNDLWQKDNSGKNVAHYASHNGSRYTLYELEGTTRIRHPENMTHFGDQDNKGRTPLMTAIVQGQVDVAEELAGFNLGRKANPGAVDAGGNTALILALKDPVRMKDVLAYLLNDDPQHFLPLNVSQVNRNGESAASLVQQAVAALTAVHVQSSKRFVREIMRRLAEEQLAKNPQGAPPKPFFQLAKSRDQRDLAELAANIKATRYKREDLVNMRDRHGDTLVQILAKHLRYPEAVEALRTMADYYGENDLFFRVRPNDTSFFSEMVKHSDVPGAIDLLRHLLQEERISLFHVDGNGDNAIMIAADLNKPEVIDALMPLGHNWLYQKTDARGYTALMRAIQHNSVEAAEAIIRHSYDLCTQDETGETALMMAAKKPELAGLVRVMLAAPNVCASFADRYGNTAESNAETSGQHELAQEIAKREDLELMQQGRPRRNRNRGPPKTSVGCEGMRDPVSYEPIAEGKGIYLGRKCQDRDMLLQWFLRSRKYVNPTDNLPIHPDDISAYRLEVQGVPIGTVQPDVTYARIEPFERAARNCKGKQDFVFKDRVIGDTDGVDIDGTCYTKDGLKKFFTSSKLYKAPHNNKLLRPADIRAYGLQVADVPIPAAAEGVEYAQVGTEEEMEGGARRRRRATIRRKNRRGRRTRKSGTRRRG